METVFKGYGYLIVSLVLTFLFGVAVAVALSDKGVNISPFTFILFPFSIIGCLRQSIKNFKNGFRL